MLVLDVSRVSSGRFPLDSSHLDPENLLVWSFLIARTGAYRARFGGKEDRRS